VSETVSVKVILNISDGVKVSADDTLELSLNCFVCERTRRTIILRVGEEAGICTPTKHLFPAKILAKETLSQTKSVELKYLVEYWFAPFVDRKYKEPAEDSLIWGRVHFSITCPKCGETKIRSVQTNLVRPFTEYCSCGNALYSETEEYPKFKKVAS